MEELIKKQIRHSNGAITYADFIEMALYHPELGYYMRDGEKIGRKGDFYTTSNVSDIYGALIAKWFHQIVANYGLPANVCEIGAGTGRFAKAFLDEWEKLSEVPVRYTLVETSPYHRKLQLEMIEINSRVRQVASLDQVEPFSGLLFANELFDALPVHVIQKKDHELYEVMITVRDDHLVEEFVPLADERILAFIERQKLTLDEGQRIEIPLAMEGLIESMAMVLQKGISVIVDYGYTREEWLDPARMDGSLRGFFKHQMKKNVLEHPGEMDITSHVHLDAIKEVGENFGLLPVDLLRQDEFFLSIGILQELEDHFDPNPFSQISKRNRAIRSLIMPGSISSSFRVIIQHKGLPEFARDWSKKK
jgi:SAM-dependent MidA family methyltransferase